MNHYITDDQILSAINTSNTFVEAASKLGISGSVVGMRYRRICAGMYSKSPEQILTDRRTKLQEIFTGKQNAHNSTVRILLMEFGSMPYQCSECCNLPTWNNKPLTLQLDHIDGDPGNHLEQNLRWLCPNCHTQTDTFGAKNRQTKDQKWDHIPDEVFIDAFISKSGNMSATISSLNLNSRNMVLRAHIKHLTRDCIIVRPPRKSAYDQAPITTFPDHFTSSTKQPNRSRELTSRKYVPRTKSPHVPKFTKDELEKLVWEMPTTKIGEMFGMSDNGIARYCKIWNISKPPRGYWMKKLPDANPFNN